MLLGLALLATIGYLAGRYARRRLVSFAVQGNSMAPELAEGDFITALRLDEPGTLETGALVIVRDPRDGKNEMVKRVSGSMSNGDLIVLGDSPNQSTDSRQLGPIPRDLVVGRVVLRYWPPSKFKVFA
jgi:nickel-type superoxide dismutase maturation protease